MRKARLAAFIALLSLLPATAALADIAPPPRPEPPPPPEKRAAAPAPAEPGAAASQTPPSR